MRKLLKIASDNQDVPLKLDEDRLMELELLGFRRGHGLVHGRNDCLTDSLLQSMVAAGIFRGSIAVPDRDEACVVSRAMLASNEDLRLRPRRRDPVLPP